MYKERIQDYKKAKADVRILRTEFGKLEKNFRCVQKNKNLVCSGDVCGNDGLAPCKKYELTVKCPYVDCLSHRWNENHYQTYIKLCNAKMDRFLAFLNLFTRIK